MSEYESTSKRVAKTAVELTDMLADRGMSSFDQLDALQIAAVLLQQQINRELQKKPQGK